MRHAFFLAALLAAGCAGDDSGVQDPEPYARCKELSDSLFPIKDRNGIAVFKVVAPDGGAFKVGKEMRVVVAGADYTSALVDLVVSGGPGLIARLPGFPATNGIKPQETCEWRFAVPESVTTVIPPIRRISLVSDSVRVKITDYTDAASYDFSGYFSVAR